MFINRLIAKKITEKIKTIPVIVVSGPKFCGKSELCKCFSKTIIDLTDMAENEYNRLLARTNPKLLFKNVKPILIDEWQEVPTIWNSLKIEADNGTENGSFLLTGSTTPNDKISLHSGAGRFARISLQTLTYYEIIHNEQKDNISFISLTDLFKSELEIPNYKNEMDFDKMCDIIIKGGWPKFQKDNISSENAFKLTYDYVTSTILSDISRIDETRKDENKVLSLLKSISRNLCMLPNNETYIKDMGLNEKMSISWPTIKDYLLKMKKIHLIFEIPVFSEDIRNNAPLKKTQKLILCDTSIATSILKFNKQKMKNQLNFLGHLFENYVIRDLSVYADYNDLDISYYKDKHDGEIDCIISNADGEWIAIEIKLGITDEEKASQQLNKACKNFTSLGGREPLKKIIVVGIGGFSYKREDGIYVIPFWNIAP